MKQKDVLGFHQFSLPKDPISAWEADSSSCPSVNSASVMARLAHRITKTISLLAVLILPVQQVVAVNCCCRSGGATARKAGANSQSGCCSEQQSSCCTPVDTPVSSCCGTAPPNSAPDTNRVPGDHCPGDCCDGTTPDLLDATSASLLSNVDATWAPATESSVVSFENPNSTPLQSTAAAFIGPSASQRCTLLCRYRL